MKKTFTVWTIFVVALLLGEYSHSIISVDILRQNISIAEGVERKGVSVTAMEISAKTIKFFIDNPKASPVGRSYTVYFKDSQQMGTFLTVLSEDAKILVPKGTMEGIAIGDSFFTLFKTDSVRGEDVCKIEIAHSNGVKVPTCD